MVVMMRQDTNLLL